MKIKELFSQDLKKNVALPKVDKESERIHKLIPEFKDETSQIKVTDNKENTIDNLQQDINSLHTKSEKADEFIKNELFHLMSRNELVHFLLSQKDQIEKQQMLLQEYKTIAKVAEIKSKENIKQNKKIKYLLHTKTNSVKFLQAKTEEAELENIAKDKVIKDRSKKIQLQDTNIENAKNHIANLEHQLELSKLEFDTKIKVVREELIGRYEKKIQRILSESNQDVIQLKTRIEDIKSKLIQANTKLRNQKAIEEEVINTIRTKFNSN